MTWDTLTGKQTFLAGLMDVDSPDWHHYWKRFYQLYKPLIASVARKRDVPHPDVDDVVQDIFRELQRQFENPNGSPGQYDGGKGRFRPYLMRLVKWRVSNRLERSRPLMPDDPLPDTLAAEDTFTTVWQSEEERLFLAMARAHIEAPLEHVQIWDCLVEKGMSPQDVAKRFGKKRSHVDTIKHRVTEKLRLAVEQIRSQHGFG